MTLQAISPRFGAFILGERPDGYHGSSLRLNLGRQVVTVTEPETKAFIDACRSGDRSGQQAAYQQLQAHAQQFLKNADVQPSVPMASTTGSRCISISA